MLLVGFGAPYWLDYGDLHGFLWRACDRGGCVSAVDSSNPEWIQATQALSVLYLVVQIVAVIFLIFQSIFLHLWLKVSVLICAGISILLGSAAVVIFGVKVEDENIYRYVETVSLLGYAYWVTVVSVILHVSFFISAFFLPVPRKISSHSHHAPTGQNLASQQNVVEV